MSRTSSQTFARRLDRKRREYIRVGRSSRPGVAILTVEVAACRRVSQRSDIRQCSSASEFENQDRSGPPPATRRRPSPRRKRCEIVDRRYKSSLITITTSALKVSNNSPRDGRACKY